MGLLVWLWRLGNGQQIPIAFAEPAGVTNQKGKNNSNGEGNCRSWKQYRY